MLKKTGYGYLTLLVALTLLTVLGKGLGPDTDAGFMAEIVTVLLILFLFWSTPIVVLVLGVVFIRRHFRRATLQRLASQAERFHTGHH